MSTKSKNKQDIALLKLTEHSNPNIRNAAIRKITENERKSSVGVSDQDSSDSDIESSDDENERMDVDDREDDPFRKFIEDIKDLESIPSIDSDYKDDDNDEDDDDDDSPDNDSDKDIKTIEFEGVTYNQNQCYKMTYQDANGEEKQYVLGIESFSKTKQDHANMILILPFEKAFVQGALRINSSELSDQAGCTAPFEAAELVRLPNKSLQVHLKHLRGPSCEEQKDMQMPDWALRIVSGRNFSFENIKPKAKFGLRKQINVGDFFCGAGGYSAGMKHNGFHVKIGVEKDNDAAKAFLDNHGGKTLFDRSNKEVFENNRGDFFERCREDAAFLSVHLKNTGTAVHLGTVDDFLQKCEDCPEYKEALGKINYIHVSPPCTGVSAAKRRTNNLRVGQEEHPDDAEYNRHSLSVLRLAELFQPDVISFENVTGMLRKFFKIKYLYPILHGLMQMGYQIRQGCLKACDYGDPQKRPRLIFLAAVSHVPLPKLPTKSHGSPGNGRLDDYVTAQDVLRPYETAPASPLPVRDPEYELKADEPTPALRASKRPRHYSENRSITVEEAKALTFPPGFVTVGNTEEQMKQIGNAVPFELATAIASEVRKVLKFEYAKDTYRGLLLASID